MPEINKIVVFHPAMGFVIDTCAGGSWTGPESEEWPNAKVWKEAKNWQTHQEAMAEILETDVCPAHECVTMELDLPEGVENELL